MFRKSGGTRRHPPRSIVFVLVGLGAGWLVARRPRLRAESRTITDMVEVDVPVSTAYNEWTQFERFPDFMEGIDEVRQLDDTLLHWGASIGKRHAEWKAKILEQEPDRRITWQSVDGKETRGTVLFESAGPTKSIVRVAMSYKPEGPIETVGSAAGLDARRIREDLRRFKEQIESQRAESGA
jgi:uncharacterized membrane protein